MHISMHVFSGQINKVSCGKYCCGHIIWSVGWVMHPVFPWGGNLFQSHNTSTSILWGTFPLIELIFLLQVDHLINQNHLFKRSIILIKAWCYYESRILGAHHGLISTYALETLVLYIFHVFNNTFTGPLEVLCLNLAFVCFLGSYSLFNAHWWRFLSRFFIGFWNSLVILIGIIFASAYGVLYPLAHFLM